MKLSILPKFRQTVEKIKGKKYLVAREETKDSKKGKIFDKIVYEKEAERDLKEYFKNNFTYNRNLSKQKLSHVWETTSKKLDYNPKQTYKYQYSVMFQYEKEMYIARSSIGIKGDGLDNLLKAEAKDKALQIISGAVLNNSDADIDDINAVIKFNKIEFKFNKIVYTRHK